MQKQRVIEEKTLNEQFATTPGNCTCGYPYFVIYLADISTPHIAEK